MGADLPPGRYIGHALQRGAACRCDQVRDSRHWTAVLAAIRRCCIVHTPGKVPSWLAGVLLASPSVLGPAGWWPAGPGRITRPGPGGPLCAARP